MVAFTRPDLMRYKTTSAYPFLFKHMKEKNIKLGSVGKRDFVTNKNNTLLAILGGQP